MIRQQDNCGSNHSICIGFYKIHLQYSILIICTIFVFIAILYYYIPHFKFIKMATGRPSSGEAELSKMIENLAVIENQRADAYRTPKIPKFFREDPLSFFVIVEASFRQARINLESTKADYLVANLDHDLIPHIKHLLELEPKPADIYTQIKNKLIQSFSISAESRLRRLLRGEVVSEGKPSLLLTRLRALNDGSCTDAVIKSIFLEQMPSQVRAILALSNVENLQELANLADKVSEASQPLNYQVASTSTHFSLPKSNIDNAPSNNHLSSLINVLTNKVEKLSNEIRNLKTGSRLRGRSNSRNFQRRDRSRSRSSQGRCFYHQRFGKNAQKCTQPCSWKVPSKSEN